MLHIHPIFEKQLKKSDKENLLRQNAVALWFVGLSGSGKSTLATGLENFLYKEGYLTKLLDGDNLRTGINNNLGFSEEERTENIRRAAEVSKLFINCGVVTLCSLISPTNRIRSMAKTIIGAENYVEIFVNCPLEVCERRDVKGLYAKARRGEIADFTGISSPFEPPEHPDLEIRTDREDLETSLKKITDYILPRIKRS